MTNAPRHGSDDLVKSVTSTSALSELLVMECPRDAPLVSVPRPEPQIIIRFGPMARRGLDACAVGVRKKVHRKSIARRQSAIAARLRLGASEAVLGVPGSAIAGRIVALEDLWGEAATERLLDQLAGAADIAGAASILEATIVERARRMRARNGVQLAVDAAARLSNQHVTAVASDLGVSERHLRRVFREAIGVAPKTFAKLARFRRALSAAHQAESPRWAAIATDAGYYDQAHLIAEFRAIAGVTPRALLRELAHSTGQAALLETDVPAAFAWQAFEYVFPSQPHTGM